MILSESLDIILECKNDIIWVTLSGPFNNEEVPSVREKIFKLIDDGSRSFVFDLERIDFIGDKVVPFFVNLLNNLKGKKGELKLVFKNDLVHDSFLPYSNIFSIYSNSEFINKRELFYSLRRTGNTLNRKTGFRISKPLAVCMLIILGGWFFSLLYIINIQNQKIHEQQNELHELTHWKEEALIEINYLQERIRPLEQLGVLREKEK
ncbi:STAS domain-containing protein [Chitinispirillales bacterium ANBcel5]|uniref:STAS domain-containing protein n=1 Tax=Cellulosispirillum alkaliphilum TaxID=3039283 RepID=UPI002A521D87|nr:STAS domain-containing protein [Chitinispirillales bacterium ANBcel5]